MTGAGRPPAAWSPREQRHVTVMIVGRVRGAHGEAACVVRNVSRRGMKARFAHAPAVGERIGVALRDLAELGATVRWTDGAHAGVEFDTPIDLARVLAGDAAAPLPRPPRFACARQTRFTCAGASHPAALVDVSLGGAKLVLARCPDGLVGHAGTLLLPVLDQPRAGVIRWHGAAGIGLRFVRPLDLAALAAVLAAPAG